jgi:hypothetical protein
MKRSFEEILRESIVNLEASGGDVEAVLGRYPEHAEELRPHLEVWVSLSAFSRRPASPSDTRAGYQRLMAALSAQRGREPAGLRNEKAMGGGFTVRYILPFLAGAAAAIGAVLLFNAVDSESGSTARAGPIAECLTLLDLNGDGALDVNDVLTMKEAIENNDPAFDFNGDGTTDIFDVVALVEDVVACLQSVQPPPPPGGGI